MIKKGKNHAHGNIGANSIRARDGRYSVFVAAAGYLVPATTLSLAHPIFSEAL